MKCQWCGTDHGPRCPIIKSIEFYQDGTVRKVEFVTVADHLAPLAPAVPNTWPAIPPINPWPAPWFNPTCAGSHSVTPGATR